MAKQTFKVLTDEQKYKVADVLSAQYKDAFDFSTENGSKYAFGVIIHSKVNGQELIVLFGEEQAVHITNLVKRRLNAPTVQSASVSIDI